MLSWVAPENRADKSEYSRVTFEIESIGDIVRLNVIHDQLKPGSEMAQFVLPAAGRVCSPA